MGGAERVIFRLTASRKTRDAAMLAQPRHIPAPAGQDLVRIGLMTDIPDNAIMRRIENVMNRQRKLYGAKIG